MSVETRLQELGITLPTPVAPVANYVPFVLTGSLLVISGQLPLVAGQQPFQGRAVARAGADPIRCARRSRPAAFWPARL